LYLKDHIGPATATTSTENISRKYNTKTITQHMPLFPTKISRTSLKAKKIAPTTARGMNESIAILDTSGNVTSKNHHQLVKYRLLWDLYFYYIIHMGYRTSRC